MNDDEFFDFCMIDRKRRIERNSNGVITVAEPAGAGTSYRNGDLSGQLANWSEEDGRGRAFASNTGFILPNSATLAPDAAWVLKSRLDRLTKEQKRRFTVQTRSLSIWPRPGTYEANLRSKVLSSI